MTEARSPTSTTILPWVVWAYLKITRITSRVTVHGEEHADHAKGAGTGHIYAFWHNRQIILPIVRKGEHIHCLISSSRDGEYIARVAALFGKVAIRGSSTRGGFDAMKQMMRVLKDKGVVAVTPDGPLGPPGEVKPGVIQMSQALGVPIVPITFDANRKKVFASWDGFNLPYPFSRIAIIFGEPFTVDATEPVDAACARLKSVLDELTARATELCT